MSSSSSAKSGSVMSISALPLPLSGMVNTESVLIIENVESVFDKNTRFRVKIGLLPLAQPGTTLQLDAGFIGGSYPVQSTIVTTAEKQDNESTNKIETNNHSKHP